MKDRWSRSIAVFKGPKGPGPWTKRDLPPLKGAAIGKTYFFSSLLIQFDKKFCRNFNLPGAIPLMVCKAAAVFCM